MSKQPSQSRGVPGFQFVPGNRRGGPSGLPQPTTNGPQPGPAPNQKRSRKDYESSQERETNAGTSSSKFAKVGDSREDDRQADSPTSTSVDFAALLCTGDDDTERLQSLMASALMIAVAQAEAKHASESGVLATGKLRSFGQSFRLSVLLHTFVMVGDLCSSRCR
jgi:hypothetical protein